MIDLVFSAEGGSASGGKNYTSFKAPGGAFFVRILESAAKTLKLGGSKIEISINLVGETKIKNLNKKYRNKNTATDVLSFPLSTVVLKKYGILPLGDIFICLSVAKKEAREENISIEKKLAWFTVHGFLHLLGYDHEKSEKDAKKIFVLEKKILRNIDY